jgi:peptide/nickel transport system substrate-binding protein
VGGVWQYEGAPVEIIILIRTEDTRREIGDYVGNQLEDIGFTVVRDYKTAAEAGPIWLSGDPNDGRFHIYTGGWVTTAVPRDLGYTLGYFFTDFGRAEPLWQAYENDPEFYEIADKLYNNDFTTLEERRELMARGLELVMMEAQRFWVVDRSPIYPKRSEINVSSDLYGGISGSWLWMNTIRRGEEVGGSVRVGLPSILTQPWNPLDGSNWIFDMMLIRATGEIAYKPDPFTGLYWPNIFERAEVTIQEGLPVGQTHDWVSLEFVPEIEVPGDAWVDWDAEEQRFITASEAFTDTQTAFSKNVVYYPADMFDSITWHDGSPLSVGDFVMGMILTFDRGKEASPIYDASKAPALRSFLGSFKGVRILSESPLVIETYTDNYQLDAELNLNTWFPYYAQGQGSWHMLALGIFAEAESLGGFSAAKAQAVNGDRFSYVSGPTVEILNAQMAKLEEGTLPYEATLSEYISTDELATRTANYKEFFRRRGHLWIGTGPFYLERAFPVEGTVILQRYAAYPFPAGQWDRFAVPAIPEVELDGPGRVTAGQAAAFDVFVTFQGEDYAQADVAQVNYLVYDATGALVHTGVAEAAGDGMWTVNLTSDVTRGLGSGSNLLEVVVVSNLVALPVSETMQFVTSQ